MAIEGRVTLDHWNSKKYRWELPLSKYNLQCVVHTWQKLEPLTSYNHWMMFVTVGTNTRSPSVYHYKYFQLQCPSDVKYFILSAFDEYAFQPHLSPEGIKHLCSFSTERCDACNTSFGIKQDVLQSFVCSDCKSKARRTKYRDKQEEEAFLSVFKLTHKPGGRDIFNHPKVNTER